MAGTLSTERLELRELSERDAPFILALLNTPGFLQHIGDRGVRSLEGARRYIQDGPAASYAAHGFGLYRVAPKGGGLPLGICGLLKRTALDHPDLGFAFLPEHWNRGYAIESALAVMGYAREALGLGRILGITNPDNHASIRVLEKAGFRFEKLMLLPGEDLEVKLYSAELQSN